MLKVITVSGDRGCTAATGGAWGSGLAVCATSDDVESRRVSSSNVMDLISSFLGRRQPLRSRDHAAAGRAKRDRHFAEMDDVAVAKVDASPDARAADEGAV